MRLMLMLVVMLVGGVLSAQSDIAATVVETTARHASNRFGDALIVTDVTAQDASGGRYRWTVDGGTLDGITLSVSQAPTFHVGQTVRINGQRVFGGHDAFVPTGQIWDQAMSYFVNPLSETLTPEAALQGIQGGVVAWQGTQAQLAVTYAGATTINTISLDRNNVFFFRRDDNAVYTGVTYYWWDGNGFLIDADVLINERYPWFVNHDPSCTGFYVENTMAHEFGHVVGLAHSTVELATMWAFTSQCETIRETLDADDVLGFESLYPATGPVPDPDPVPDPKPCRKRGRWAC